MSNKKNRKEFLIAMEEREGKRARYGGRECEGEGRKERER